MTAADRFFSSLLGAKYRVLNALLVLSLCLQIGFWFHIKNIRPELGIVPDVPGKQEIQAFTFGDDEFYFRVLAFIIQNSGDTFGRFTPLRYYDLNKLYYWFILLDGLDSKSNMMPTLAAYYFAQTQNAPDVRYVVDYLYVHATRDVEHKWWWLIQAIYLAQYKLKDMDLALKVSKPLLSDKVLPWAQEMAAIVHEQRGEMEDALKIMETIKNNAKNLSDSDLKYILYFIEERLGKLDEMGKRVKNNVPASLDQMDKMPPHP